MKTFRTFFLALSLFLIPVASHGQGILGNLLKGVVQKGVVSAAKGPSKDPKEAAGESATRAFQQNANVSLTRNIPASVLNAGNISTKEADLTKTLRSSFGGTSSKSGQVTDPSMQEIIGTADSKAVFEEAATAALAEKSQLADDRKSAIRTERSFRGAEALGQLSDFPALVEQIRKMEARKGSLFAMDNLLVKKAGSGMSRIVEFPGTNTRIEIKGDAFYASGGGAPGRDAMNEFLNEPMRNGTYYVDEHLKFVTDAEGRTILVECFSSELSKSVTRAGMAPDYLAGVVEMKGGKQGVHGGGHIQQHATGAVNEDINLLPMRIKQQRSGSWVNLEKKEREAIASGKEVWNKKTITYNPDGSYVIHVELTMSDPATGKMKVVKKDFDKFFSPKDK